MAAQSRHPTSPSADGQTVEGAQVDPPDAAVLLRAKQGDYEAFEELVRRYRERVYRLAHGMTRSESEAQEVVQETFLQAFRSLRTFREDSAPGSWIYRIAVNATLMRLRSGRRKPLLSIDDIGDPARRRPGGSVWPTGDWARQPDDQLDSRQLRERIEDAIAKLPEKYRLVLLLRDVEGQSNEEVAHTLGLTVSTVKARLHRSRLIVRRELEHYFESGR